MRSKEHDIDFVILWVNPRDEKWLKEKEKYEGKTEWDAVRDENRVARYRDWDNLHYWFRAIEKYAPWVRRIHFVTWNSVPEWLNIHHPKLRIVLNREILPDGCDPVFSPNPLETNLHRIPGLAEHFVYFNDDMFITNHVEPTDYFVQGLPREMAVSYALSNTLENDTFPHMLLTMTGVINGFFDKRDVQKKNWWKWFAPVYGKQLINTIMTMRQGAFSGILIPHLPSPMRKSTYEEVWDRVPQILLDTAAHKFRTPMDVTQYLFRYWAICKGEFIPTNLFRFGRECFLDDRELSSVCDIIKQQAYKMICINDGKDITHFEESRDRINQAFDAILPEKSLYEITNPHLEGVS